MRRSLVACGIRAVTPRIHYAGEMLCRSGKDGVLHLLGGFAACCYGDRAVRIRRERRSTHDRALVTCKACRAVMAREIAPCGNCHATHPTPTLAPVTVPWSVTPWLLCPSCVARGVASGILTPRHVEVIEAEDPCAARDREGDGR